MAETEYDVVCGMMVDPATAAGVSEYKGRRYYFCSAGCKREFDNDPGAYADNRPDGGADTMGHM
jgi:Cu+-exporting ATPase